MNKATLPVLISKLLQTSRYPHPVTTVELIETHISWVLLTGDFVYKIKKPVNLGFLDFSTLEKRHQACTEELRLNTRLAPELYLEVVPITGSDAAPEIGGEGEAIEYAVLMHEFPQELQMDRWLGVHAKDHAEAVLLFRRFGARLAAFHAALSCAGPDTDFGKPAVVRGEVMENFRHLVPLAGGADIASRLDGLRDWSDSRFEVLRAVMGERKAAGFVREGHGDLHLRNLVLRGKEILAFDCIEFSAELRWIDVINDVAFLFMDLLHHDKQQLAFGFLNAWLARSGDYPALRLLRFYAVYRAMVRAKIAGIELIQERWPDARDEPASQQHLADLTSHLDLAQRLAHEARPLLVITHGVSGAGKSWLARRLAGELGAIHVRSDVERKRLFKLAPEARSAAANKPEMYGAAASEKTYRRLLDVAATCLDAGWPVIVDATFLRQVDRDAFARLATRKARPFAILDCRASLATLRERVANRTHEGRDASEADVQVLEMQLRDSQPLVPAEVAKLISVQTDADIDVRALASRLRRLNSPGRGLASTE